MPKFSFASWNIRHFQGKKKQLEKADSLLSDLNPDIFGLIECKARKEARSLMFEHFPEYDFADTDSTGGLDVLVG